MSQILVTGGAGFLGKRIVELLLERGDTVHFIARGAYPEVEALGAKGFQGDLRDPDAVARAVEGCDTVFHVAAKAGFWGPRDEYTAINVDGTRNVIEAARAAGCTKLVYTSTPSVVGYGSDHVNAPQDTPYDDNPGSWYPVTKAEAERLVLAANGDGLATVSLRPHLIFGPGDNNLIPRVVSRARTGKLPIVGDGSNEVDMTYIDNAAWAHLDAADALTGPDAACAGKAYFISNDDPVALWGWLNDELFPPLAIPRIERKVSLGVARFLGWILEWAYTLLPLSGEPRMTPFIASGLARTHWYDMTPAKRDFGYTVRVDMAEGTRRTIDWFKTQTPGPEA